MNTRNPMEADCPPDHAIDQFTIKFSYDNENLVWSAYCPEWKCEVSATTATEAAEKITGDIDDHNDKEAQQVIDAAIDANPNAVLNALCEYANSHNIKENLAKQPRELSRFLKTK